MLRCDTLTIQIRYWHLTHYSSLWHFLENAFYIIIPVSDHFESFSSCQGTVKGGRSWNVIKELYLFMLFINTSFSHSFWDIFWSCWRNVCRFLGGLSCGWSCDMVGEFSKYFIESLNTLNFSLRAFIVQTNLRHTVSISSKYDEWLLISWPERWGEAKGILGCYFCGIKT